MAYYNKEEVKKYLEDSNTEAHSNGLKTLTPIEKSISQLEKEEEIVGFFWIDMSEKVGDDTKIKMQGKTFVRIDHNLYTDDRFALDLYQSQQEGKTVSEVIKNRMMEQERAKKTIEPKKDEIENKISDQTKK